MKLCALEGIKKKYTKVKCPQTNGKAERVIRTIMEMWHEKEEFKSREERRKSIKRFVNWYNCVKSHK
jgi:transposase InsO family protein